MDRAASESVLYLIRAAIVEIGSDPRIELGDVHLRRDGTVVESGPSMSVEGEPVGSLVVALAPIGQEFALEAEAIQIPSDARRSAEEAIETLARLVALEHRTSHAISSPLPYIGFLSEEEDILDRLVDKRVEQPVICSVRPTGGGTADILTAEVISGLADRIDGVGLLAEALSNRNALGRYHELIRLFERGFGRKAGGLTAFLVPFLTDPASPHGFTKKEIHTWVEARPKAAHADRRPEFLLEADVRPWVGRMEEAAYDVLLNKANWRQPTATRRNLWRAAAGSSDTESGIYVTSGRAASLSFQLLDGFKAYPLMLAGPMETILPGGIWLMGDISGGTLQKFEGGARLRGPRGGRGLGADLRL